MRKGGREYVASGDAFLGHAKKPAHLVVLTYETRHGQEKAFAATQLSDNQEVVLAVLGRGRYPVARWVKSFAVQELPPGEIRLSAWAFDAYTGRAYQLAGTHRCTTMLSALKKDHHDPNQ